MNLIGDISFVDTIQDFGTSPELNGPVGVKTHLINGVMYVYVASGVDDGIQVLTLDDDGTLTPIASVSDSSAYGLDHVEQIEIVQVGSEHFLIASSSTEDALTVFRLDDDGEGTDGHLVFVETYRNFAFSGESTIGQGLLDNVYHLEVHKVGNRTFVAATASNSDAVSIYQISNNGSLTRRDAVTDSDDADLLLHEVRNLKFHDVNGQTFLFTVASYGDQGFSVFSVANNGALTNVFNYSASSNDDYDRFAIADIGNKTYLVANDAYFDQLHVFEVGSDGSMTFISATPNYVNGSYSDIRDLQVMEVAGVTYFIASAQDQDTLLVMTLNNDQEIEIVQTITSTSELDVTSGLTFQQMGDRVFLLATGINSDKVSVYEIGGSDDALVGTGGNDAIVGLNGDDDLLGRAGRDTIQGLNGDDVISGHKGNDHLFGGNGADIISGGANHDTVEGGAGSDILIGGAGRDALSYVSASSAVTVNLETETASGSHANGDFFAGFEDLLGSSRNDDLTGSSSDNRIYGNNGADEIAGLAGNDDLYGGAGKDTVKGGNGNDYLNGGGGNDRILGAVGQDSLIGGAGNDTLIGGIGDDSIKGNGGSDTFVFNSNEGNDTVFAFEANKDVVDFSSNSEINSFSDFQTRAVTVSGNTIVLLNGDNSITFDGVAEGSFSASNFLF